MTTFPTIQGPREVRTHESARARIPMTAGNVRSIIDEMHEAKASKAARKSMAQNAIRVGNNSEEGRAVWRDYLAAL